MKNKIQLQTFKEYNNLNENGKLNEDSDFGIVNIHIDGEGFIKYHVIQDIYKIIKKYQGERHLFIDGEEVNPYKNSGG